jgi:hemoglobin
MVQQLHRLIFCMTVVSLVALGGCQTPRQEVRPDSLYARAGGMEQIERLASDWVDRMLVNPRINLTRMGTEHAWVPTIENVQNYKRQTARWLAAEAEGPERARDLRAIHRGMRVTRAEFDAAVEDLRTSLQRLRIPERQQREWVRIVQAARVDIVERR